MVNSSAVPSSYTSQWNASVAPSVGGSSANAPRHRVPNMLLSNGPPSSSRGQGTSRARYNTSCNNCRRSRVRCSGGSPCQRCASLPDAAGCVYRLSRRHGKRKASVKYDVDSNSRSSQHPDSALETPRTNVLSPAQSCLHMQLDLGDLGQRGSLNQLSIPSTEISMNTEVETDRPAPLLEESAFLLLGDNSPALEDLLNMVPSPLPPFSPIWADSDMDILGQASSCNCAVSNQALLNHLEVATKQPDKMSLDRILQTLQDAAAYIARSDTCTQCGSGCSHLMSLAFLHQRQAALMCAIAKNRAAYLGDSGANPVRLTLGMFQLTPQDDLDHKRLLILSAARRIDAQVAGFDDATRDYQNMEVVGSQPADGLEQTESAKLNIRWLVDVARNLRGRLNIIISILEKSD